MLLLFAIGTFLATIAGGVFGILQKDALHGVLGFSAGAVIGVAFFDLMPEALSLGSSFGVEKVTLCIALGFLFYMFLDRLFMLHAHGHHTHGHNHEEDENEVECANELHQRKGFLGAASLSIHSFLDGVAIGLAFQASPVVGAVVALAVLAHDFSDGLNTVSVVLKNKGKPTNAFKWLIADALAPVLGIISTLFFTIPDRYFGLLLAVFCGFFLYIGASDLIPESHHAHPRTITTIATILGAGFIYFVISFAML